MSRIIVKNLPAYVTSDRLKKVFSQDNGPGGTLTDVKVALRPDGTSRRFGFIGYKTDADAKKAQEWFNRSFIDTTRITVEVIDKGVAENQSDRPTKRPRLGLSPSDRATKDAYGPIAKQSQAAKDIVGKTEPKGKKAAQLDEFLEVMQPRTKKGRSWANEDNTAPSTETQAESSLAVSSAKVKKSKKKAVETEQETSEDPVQQEDLDDIQWMKRRMTKALDAEEEVEKAFEQDPEDQTVEEPEAKVTPEEPKEPPDPAKQLIEQSARLFVRNLAFSCTESDLQSLFSPFGEVEEIHIPLDHSTKEAKGLAFVRFVDPSPAIKAFETLDKTSFQGRLLHILPAVDRQGRGGPGDDANKKLSVKEDKEKKRKATGTKAFNWSMLYMNSDAVASSIADRMNVPKADILNPESDSPNSTSAAVKLALAETHIIQETKSYLESEGIDLSSFADLAITKGQKVGRSDTCILVKNIPYGTSANQIREMFESHGELSRVLVPPAGTLAVVDFVHPDDAARAFKAVVYSRLGSSIVYLEKAPVGIFVSKNEDEGAETKMGETTYVGKHAVRIQDEDITGRSLVTDDSAEAAPGSTLFIKNLSFATTSERLTNAFRHLPSFAFARVQTKPDPKGPGRLSMGYGFIGFKNSAAAKSAIQSMNDFVLDGHALVVKFAGRGQDEVEGKLKGDKLKAKTTKMIVKNVPFEASKEDIRDLFGTHGQLKSVRLPKKFDSRSRGFAFLDFVTRHEAENAYAALQHTHLLGRHLVLDWADDEVDVDVLRKRAGVAYGDGGDAPGKKRKIDLNLDGENDDV